MENFDSKTLKQKAEITLERGKEIILQSIPNEEIVSIYIKGSFVQDELRPDSDIDMVVILKSEQYLPEIYSLTEQYGKTTEPPLQIVAYTLKELQTGEHASNRTKNTTSVSRFVKHIDALPIIFGNKPEGPLFTRTNEKDLSVNVNNFRTMFIPDYRTRKFSFNQLVKQVFWLVEAEQRLKGIEVGYSWQKLAVLEDDPNHIIHLAIKYRNEAEITEDEQKQFLEKLEIYLGDLESLR